MPWITVNSEPPKPTTFEDLGYVQVVRCKDCIFGEQINDRYICTNVGHCQSKSNAPDWFCADGKRR